MASKANLGKELHWGAHAKTRMDWGNVSHILETLSRNGGKKEVEAVMGAHAGDWNPALKALEKKARLVFGREKNAREDLRGSNW